MKTIYFPDVDVKIEVDESDIVREDNPEEGAIYRIVNDDGVDAISWDGEHWYDDL